MFSQSAEELRKESVVSGMRTTDKKPARPIPKSELDGDIHGRGSCTNTIERKASGENFILPAHTIRHFRRKEYVPRSVYSAHALAVCQQVARYA